MATSDVEMEMESLDSLINSVNQNPYDYDAHVQLINTLRQMGNLEGTRSARLRFQSILLLKKSDWIQWLEDECEILVSNPGEIKILFELALTDCPSVRMWLLYLRFCGAHPELVQDLNSEFKRAIALISWDLRQGHLIFIEQSKLLNQPLTVNRAIPYTSQAKNELNIEGFVGPSPFEEFEKDFPHNLEQYLEAIKLSKHVTSQDKLTLSRVLFERAIEISKSSFEIWEFYIKYLRVEMKVSNVILSLNSRLVRAHPLNVQSWIIFFENVELFTRFNEFSIIWNEKLPKELLKNHETFLTLNLNRLDFLRRTLKDKNEICLAFQTAIYDEEQQFGGKSGTSSSTSTTADPQERLSRYFAQVLINFGEIEKFRQVWNQILKEHAREAAFWLEYLQLEKAIFINENNKENNNLTSGFKRAVSAVTDYPETIFYEWLQFEKQNGSLQSLLDARERVENQRKLLADREKQRKIKEQKQNFVETKSQLRKRPRGEIEPMKLKLPVEQVEKIVKKFNPDATLFVNNLPFNFEESDIENFFNRLISEFKGQSDKDEYSVKSIRMHRNVNNDTFKGHATVEFDSQQTAQILLEKFNKQSADVSGRPVFLAKYSSPLEKKRQDNNTPTTRSFDESDAKTLYISNIPIDGTINVDSLMKNIQGVEQIRHVTGKKFAYIEFSNEEMAKNGLKDIELMKIAGIKVAFSNPPKEKGNVLPVNSNTTVTSTSNLLRPRSLQIKKP